MTISTSFSRWLLLCFICIPLLNACGGGDGDVGNNRPPNPPPNPPAGSNGSATLTWNSVTTREDASCLSDAVGYTIYAGTAPGNFSSTTSVALANLSCAPSGQSNACGAIQTCSYTRQNLAAGTWYFAVAVYDSLGAESLRSNEMSRTVN